MAKSQLEKAIEKQIKESQKQAKDAEKRAREQKRRDEEAAKIERAKTIVEAQPMIGSLRQIDDEAKIFLEILLNNYDGNDQYYVEINSDSIPNRMAYSLGLELEKLRLYGLVSSYNLFLCETEVYLTTKATTYFDDLEKEKKIINDKNTQKKNYDVFISHASKDKLSFVDELVDGIKKLGVRIFYDKDEFSWGDNWKEKILDGTQQSEFAVIVISDNFFDRKWTETELNEFLQRQNESGQKTILPLLYGITYSDVAKKYPELEFIQSLKADEHNVDEIVILLARELIKRYKENK